MSVESITIDVSSPIQPPGDRGRKYDRLLGTSLGRRIGRLDDHRMIGHDQGDGPRSAASTGEREQAFAEGDARRYRERDRLRPIEARPSDLNPWGRSRVHRHRVDRGRNRSLHRREGIAPRRVARVGRIAEFQKVRPGSRCPEREQGIGGVGVIGDRDLPAVGVVDREDGVEVCLQVVDLVLEAVAPDFKADPFPFLGREDVPVDVFKLADSARHDDRQDQLLGRLRTIVGPVILLGDDGVVDDHNQAHARNPLRRCDANLTRAERCILRDLDPRPDLRVGLPATRLGGISTEAGRRFRLSRLRRATPAPGRAVPMRRRSSAGPRRLAQPCDRASRPSARPWSPSGTKSVRGKRPSRARAPPQRRPR